MKKFPFTHCVRKECFRKGGGGKSFYLRNEQFVTHRALEFERRGGAHTSAKIVCILSHLGWSVLTSVGIVWKFLKGPWNVNEKEKKIPAAHLCELCSPICTRKFLIQFSLLVFRATPTSLYLLPYLHNLFRNYLTLSQGEFKYEYNINFGCIEIFISFGGNCFYMRYSICLFI